MDISKLMDREIDEKATIKVVKEQLEFLSSNCWLLQQEAAGIVEDSMELLDFLPYTRSIINVSQSTNHYDSSSKVLQAMERRNRVLEKERKIREDLITRMEEILMAFAYLPPKERDCLYLKYVKHESIEKICIQMNHMSYRTVTRMMRQGFLHLAQLLDLEVSKHP